MYRQLITAITCVAALALVLPIAAQAQTTLPEGHPQLPAGHPPMPTAQGELPAGHPQIPGQGQLPAGHPPMPGQGQLPAGHPQIPGQGQLPAGHPAMPGAEQPAAAPTPFTGSVTIKTEMGTKDAAIPADLAVRVDFYAGQNIIKSLDGKIDQHGIAMFEKVDLPQSVQALVTVTHNTVPYRGLTQIMSTEHPDQIVRIKVYETTSDNPGWTVDMRHITVELVPQGLAISEMMAITVPGDRTWVGKPLTESDTEPATIVLPLSENLLQILPGRGLKSERVKVVGNRIVDHLPVVPGTVQVQYAYLLPVKDGKAELTIENPALTKKLVIFAKDDGTKIEPVNLGEAKSMQMGPQKALMFTAEQAASGQKYTLKFSELPAISSASADGHTDDCCEVDMNKTKTADASETPEKRSDAQAKIIAGIGAGVLGVGAAVVLMFKKPQKTQQDNSEG